MKKLSITLLAVMLYLSSPAQSFTVIPNDYNEFNVHCRPFNIEVWQDDSLMLQSCDTLAVVRYILKDYQGLGLWVYLPDCREYYKDGNLAGIVYQLIEGAGCDGKTISIY